LPDLAQVDLYTSVAIFSGHISSHELGRKVGGKGTKRRSARNHGIFGMHLVAFGELLNKVKYRN